MSALDSAGAPRSAITVGSDEQKKKHHEICLAWTGRKAGVS